MTKLFKIMKKKSALSIKILIVAFFLFSLGNTYSQDQNLKDEPLFGNNITPKNVNPQTGIIRCATVEYEQYLQEKNPKRMTNAQFETWLAPLVEKQKILQKNSKIAATVIQIPVVVHVIHNGEAIGTAPNITDNQVQSQITVLNQDFRRKFESPGYNDHPDGADVEIEFVLAKQDPNGNPTNGIDRVNMCQPSWATNDIETIVKPSTIWDPTQYLNMWTVNFNRGDLLGYAQPPDNSGLSGIGTIGGDANTDGVVSSYKYFGSIAENDGTFILDPKYNKGRTMTHEVGHWLGLIHIWGNSNCGDDHCADTPTHNKENYDCPSPRPLSCDTPPVNEMIENYMDYTDDYCMNIFTEDQKTRMLTVMNNSPRRASLKTSSKDDAISLVTNDAEIKIEGNKCQISTETAPCSTPESANKKVLIYNRGNNLLTSASFTHTINGGGTQTYSWTGSLAQDKSASITLLNTSTVGNLNCTITAANGGTDQRTSNNSATATFVPPVPPSNYTFTEITFSLQLDKYGSEVSWNLKDGAGATIKSGGSYPDKLDLPLPDLITENWILNNNQCYTFTIIDSESDGVCCGDSGNGYFELKSTTDSTIILYGSEFGEIAKKSFTINTLGTNEFEISNEIYAHPNPTKGSLTIHIPSDFNLPNSLTINNSLGQIVSKKEVTTVSDLTINTTSLSNGVYFITLVNENQKRTLRFIKE